MPETIKCPNCDGTGKKKVGNTEVKCPNCGGIGKVFAPRKKR